MLAAKISSALALALGIAAPHPAPREDPARAGLERISWIEGTWRLQEGERTILEHWLPLAGSTLMGLSHTYDDERSYFFEYLRIALVEGEVVYVAQPLGHPPVSFRAVELDGKVAVFEKPDHDHPQRIRYERTAEGLRATISMLDGTRAKSFEFRAR